ncbi:MAG TPA: STAS domain-containing protein [Solirubrobacterales bacterium]|nr:STAS domain-containing protein [Solirubrobacterales bacterium]
MPLANAEVKDGLLSVRQAIEGERIRLALHGELDLANAMTAEMMLQEALSSGREVLVDLGKLEFIDSTGISILVVAMRGENSERISFLPCESAPVRRVLSLTGVDERMRFASTGEGRSDSLLPAA